MHDARCVYFEKIKNHYLTAPYTYGYPIITTLLYRCNRKKKKKNVASMTTLGKHWCCARTAENGVHIRKYSQKD